MTAATKKDLSKWMSGYLDEIGFDRKRIQERIVFSNKCSRAKDISTKYILKKDTIEKIFVGSFREGIGMNFCNDTDILQINHAVFCCDGKTSLGNGTLNFKMEQKRAPAGYTLLKLINTDTDSDTFKSLKYAVVDKKRGKYLSSKLFMTKHDDVFQFGEGSLSKNTYYKSPKGPSIPKYVESHWIEKYFTSKLNLTDKGMDFVRAFPCQAEENLEAWKKRDRKCGWPSQKIIANVMSMPVYVVPAGKKGSINKDLQWRISFSMAETHLIQAFNDTQTKVYALMKLIAKHILQPICSRITSYVVKTVTLWQAETIPQKSFCKKHLLSRLMDALAFLKTAVENKNLPNYMIPQNNLFANKVTKKEQELLLARLDFLQVHGLNKVSDFVNGRLNIVENIQEISESLYIGNFINKAQTCAFYCFTTEELANYFSTMYTYRSWWKMWCYNAIFIWIPYYFKYGKQGFDPLCIELPESKAEEKQNEAIIGQEQNKTAKESTSIQTVEQSELDQNSEEESKFGFLFQILQFISIIITALLLVHGRGFLKLLRTLIASDHIVIETDEEQIISNAA